MTSRNLFSILNVCDGGKYVSLRQAPTANSQSNGGDDDSDTSSVFSFKTQEDGIPITTTTSKKTVPCVLGQDSSATKDNIGKLDLIHIHRSWYFLFLVLTVSSCRGEKDMSNDQHLMDDSEQEESLVSILEDSVFTLMLSRRLHYLYNMLVDECEGPQLDSLIGRVLSRSKCFLSAAFAKQGKVGCGSLIYCIALIGGDQRVRLLDQIADVSDFLSYDPYGNYVVQNLLGLKNEDVTKKIMSRLQNEIMGLAKRRGGCLVVEKCMEASDDGIITVAMEILDSGEQLFDLLEIIWELCD
ncbi:UNVERIFIED_CONTAM: putative pumilio21 [Sesamum calycinum]|uniref:Pumilio21 n=1 Tax=Sesamum calycinum TaxID=2727403 RepID=A0AAW2J2Z0_9LAMI